jgi:heme-degrading monooxygenase HmoA
MTYTHVANMSGKTIDDFRAINEKTPAAADTDGLLVQTAGSDPDGLHVVTVWQSKAHLDRFEAEHLFPAFQALGIAGDVMEKTTFTIFDSDESYLA